MACFLVPAAEAIVTAAAANIAKNREKKISPVCENAEISVNKEEAKQYKIPFSRKLRWLTNLLLGGSVLLLFEHIWHGEIAPYFPFLTAASNPQDAAEMLYEMGTAGVAMALLTTAIWGVMLLVAHIAERKANACERAEENIQ